MPLIWSHFLKQAYSRSMLLGNHSNRGSSLVIMFLYGVKKSLKFREQDGIHQTAFRKHLVRYFQFACGSTEVMLCQADSECESWTRIWDPSGYSVELSVNICFSRGLNKRFRCAMLKTPTENISLNCNYWKIFRLWRWMRQCEGQHYGDR